MAIDRTPDCSDAHALHIDDRVGMCGAADSIWFSSGVIHALERELKD